MILRIKLILKHHIKNALQYIIPDIVTNKIPKYWGLSIDKSQLEFIDTIGFTQFPKNLHVTLAYSRTDLQKYWSLQEKKLGH